MADLAARVRQLEDAAGSDRARIEELERQRGVDTDRIAEFERAAGVDRDVIAALRAEGVLEQEKTAQLEQALVTARRIGAAVGILMATHQLTNDRAFAVLAQVSQTQNRKLRDVAEDVLFTGTVDVR